MAAKYDIESFCEEIKTVLSASFNSKLSAITAEKGDSLTLKTIDSNAYFFQELNENVVNFDPYVLYSVENIESQTLGHGTIQRATAHVILVLADAGDSLNTIAKKMFRYQRAMKEIFESYWINSPNGIRIEITSLVPVQFSLMNSSKTYRAIGVALTGNFS